MNVRPRMTRKFSVIVAGLFCGAVVLLAAGTATADSIAEGTSQVTAVQSKAADAIKESAITTKVKARMAARHYATLATVRVNTDNNGIVWLSGTVSTIDAAALAGEIARDTEGVIAVHNAIVVQ
jgi:hyperosmotically inducible protein